MSLTLRNINLMTISITLDQIEHLFSSFFYRNSLSHPENSSGKKVPSEDSQKSLTSTCSPSSTLIDYFTVPAGQLTFDSEGNDSPSSPYYSRVASIPPSPSGITIGRGLDLGHTILPKANIKKILHNNGMSDTQVDVLLGAYGLVDTEEQPHAVENYFSEHADYFSPTLPNGAPNPDRIIITPKTQYDLFNATYQAYEQDTERVYKRTQATQAENGIDLPDFSDLPASTQELIVDMHYHGDWGIGRYNDDILTGIADDDKTQLLRGISNQTKDVDPARILNRKNFIEKSDLTMNAHLKDI